MQILNQITSMIRWIWFGDDQSSETPEAFRSETFNFEVTLPPGWPGSRYNCWSPQLADAVSTAAISILSGPLKESQSLESSAQAITKGVERFKDVECTPLAETQLAGKRAISFSCTFSIDGRASRLKQVSYFLHTATHRYVFMASALKDDYEKYAKDIESIIASFKFIEAK